MENDLFKICRDFMDGYLDTLKRRCGTKRIHANVVYQDYISDREHIHMNSTQWETLTDFVKWMGREGEAVLRGRHISCVQKKKKIKIDLEHQGFVLWPTHIGAHLLLWTLLLNMFFEKKKQHIVFMH